MMELGIRNLLFGIRIGLAAGCRFGDFSPFCKKEFLHMFLLIALVRQCGLVSGLAKIQMEYINLIV